MNVYDFDNTIYKGESVLDFYFFCLKKDLSLISYLPIVVFTLIKYKLCIITTKQLYKISRKYASDFITKLDKIDDLVVEFWNINEKKIKPFYKEIKKDDDIIISASFDILLEEICKRVGIKNYVSSKIDKETGRVEYLCFHSNKAEIFLQKFKDCNIDNFYSDSKNDLPLMKLAKKTYMVKGNRIFRYKVKGLTEK